MITTKDTNSAHMQHGGYARQSRARSRTSLAQSAFQYICPKSLTKLTALDTTIGEEEDSHLGDFIKDETVVGPEDAASYAMLQEQIKKLLGTLTEREQRVLILRFGLEDGKSRTLEEVGREFKVTRERIRQIEAKALRKLRHPSRARMLKGYDIS